MQTHIHVVPARLLFTSRRVSSTVSPTDAAERISDFVVKAEHLTSVYCGIPDKAAMKHLVLQPSISYLTIDIPDDDGDRYELVEDIHQPSIEKFSRSPYLCIKVPRPR